MACPDHRVADKRPPVAAASREARWRRYSGEQWYRVHPASVRPAPATQHNGATRFPRAITQALDDASRAWRRGPDCSSAAASRHRTRPKPQTKTTDLHDIAQPAGYRNKALPNGCSRARWDTAKPARAQPKPRTSHRKMNATPAATAASQAHRKSSSPASDRASTPADNQPA